MKHGVKYTLEKEIEGKVFSFSMDTTADLAYAYSAAFEFLAVIKENLDKRNKEVNEVKEKEASEENKEDTVEDKTD